MSRFAKSVKVVANPFSQLDHKGRPCGVVPVEPTSFGGFLGFVGAKVDKDKTTIIRKGDAAGDIRGGRQDTVFAFSTEPVDVARSTYYRDALRAGSLLPATEDCAKWAGVAFAPVTDALRGAQAKAEAEFEANYGEGSLQDLRGKGPLVAESAPVESVDSSAVDVEAKAKAEAEAKAAAEKAAAEAGQESAKRGAKNGKADS